MMLQTSTLTTGTPRKSRRGTSSGPRGAADTTAAITTPDQPPLAIYYLYPLLAGPPELWEPHFARASAMGFDTLMLAPPFATDSQGDAAGGPPPIADHQIFHRMLGGGSGIACLAEAASSAAQHGLRLMLDLDISRIAAGAKLVSERPDWFVPAARGAAFHYLAKADETTAWWDQQIAAWQSAGLAGFRCLAAGPAEAAIWARLIAAAKARDPRVTFLLWTPGLPPGTILALRHAGFDFAFSSSCWWDFKAGWLNEDAARIAVIGPAVAMPEAPYGFRCADLDPQGRIGRRALAFAAHYAGSWLMPMGLEYGATSLLDRHGDERAFTALQQAPNADLTEAVRAANAARAAHPAWHGGATARLVSSPGSAVAVLARRQAPGDELVMLINTSAAAAQNLQAASFLPLMPGAGAKLTPLAGAQAGQASEITPASSLSMQPAEVALFSATALPPIITAPPPQIDALPPRIAIEQISPQVDDGQFPVRRIVGEMLSVTADILADGHGKLAADIEWRQAGTTGWQAAPMRLAGNDRWQGSVPLQRLGRYALRIAAWADDYASFTDELAKKHAAGAKTRLEMAEGILLLRQAAETPAGAALQDLVTELGAADEETKRTVLLSARVQALMRQTAPRKFLVHSHEVTVDAERRAAGFAAWYEIFPRSQGADPSRHGTFRDVIARLPAIRDMGFDVLYFPPIHPIGRVNRKGKNNSLTAGPDDPGSPYAIGAAEGGHDALHPELGSFEDFQALRAAAAAEGIEIALDFAIQCAPDHPWLKAHPEWFAWRPDGSLRYAENPPKKYEDIVNVDFYAPGAVPSLWLALRDVVQFWVDQGIRLFRVDNPHTKPLPFWQWMIGDIRARHPDTVFLAEAFTRPKLMYRLAKIGFSQSYTYFTWRHTKQEFIEYLSELTQTAPRDFFRPHFFVNTPDINPHFLQTAGRAGFLIRAALAATLSGLWGVYNGFELCESSALPGREEYRDSEKYQFRAWDHDRPGNIIAEITRLNQIRRSNAALNSHLGLEFLNASSQDILYFSKTAADGNTILVAINLDPAAAHEADIELPLWRFGIADDGALAVEDLLHETQFTLYGKYQHIRLDPAANPYNIWRVQRPAA